MFGSFIYDHGSVVVWLDGGKLIKIKLCGCHRVGLILYPVGKSARGWALFSIFNQILIRPILLIPWSYLWILMMKSLHFGLQRMFFGNMHELFDDVFFYLVSPIPVGYQFLRYLC